MGLGIKTGLKKLRMLYRYGSTSVYNEKGEDTDILLLCHALEKGMGVPNVKRGYGREKAEKLIHLLLKKHEDGDINGFAYQESIAILKAYFCYHKSMQFDLSELEEKAAVLFDDASSDYRGGYTIISHDDLMKGNTFNLKGFVESRHSMRSFSKEPVSIEELNSVIGIAKRAPSACNRQPWKFYTSFEGEKIREIEKAIPKQSFLSDIPFFGVVTADRSLFSLMEVNQWFTNGGIFLGFLTLAFHSLGIGSCIFQYPLPSKKGGDLRKSLAIPNNEEIIAIVGYGKYPENAKCIIAERRPADEILKIR